MKSNVILILVIVVIFAAAVIGLLCIVLKIKRSVRDFSRSAFGTYSLKEGFSQVEQEYASTPKSVSAMTSLYLPKIIKDFPDFSYDEMKAKAENAITSYLLAINSSSPEMLQEGNSELQNKLANIISDLKTRNQTEHYDSIKIHRTECTNYAKRNGRCIITFQTSIQFMHYTTNSSGNLVVGNKTMPEQSRYEADLIYIQDRTLVENDADGTIGLNCPNCGAPLEGLGAKQCPYCGTPIIELNIHAWSFSDIREK